MSGAGKVTEAAFEASKSIVGMRWLSFSSPTRLAKSSPLFDVPSTRSTTPSEPSSVRYGTSSLSLSLSLSSIFFLANYIDTKFIHTSLLQAFGWFVFYILSLINYMKLIQVSRWDWFLCSCLCKKPETISSKFFLIL